MRRATTTTLAAAALLTTVLTVAHPADAHRHPAANWTAAHLGTDSTVEFAMNKWLDDKGGQKATVNGKFTDFTVELNKPVAKLTSLKDLHGLLGRVTVNLASVETGNPARNQNISQSYFQTGKFAKAVVTLTGFRPVGLTKDQLKTAQEADLTAGGNIDLHGVKKPLKATQWHVAKVDNGFKITTKAPISLASADFGLPAADLLKVCGHAGLDPAAQVNVSVLLQP